jgi:hypothetical protein
MKRRSTAATATAHAEVKEENERDDDVDTDTITDLEKIRQENIRRNEEFLANVGLFHMKDSISREAGANAKAAAAKRKLVRVERKVKEEPVVVRRSSRVTMDKLKQEIADLTRSGDSTSEVAMKEAQDKLEALESRANAYSNVSAEDAGGSYSESNTRIEEDTFPMIPLWNAKSVLSDDTAEDVSNKWNREVFALLATDVSAKSPAKKSKRAGAVASASDNTSANSKMAVDYDDLDAHMASLKKLSVAENDVAKLTEARITATAFIPVNDKIVCCAGDKIGVVGIWNVSADPADSLSGGVYKFRPHISNITKLHSPVADGGTKLFTSSYDGTIRRMDLEKESFELAFLDESDIGFSDVDFSDKFADLALVGRFDGCAGLVDFRTSNNKRDYAWLTSLHETKINSIQRHPTDDNYLITASGGTAGVISIWDWRKVSVPAARAGSSNVRAVNELSYHSKSINAASVSPDGQYLVSVSQDNTVKVATNFLSPQPSSVQSASISHNNFTGRWLSTFRPTFDPKLAHTFVLGSMTQPRCMEIYTPTSASNAKGVVRLELSTVLRAEYLASVCSRNAFHPTLDIVAGGNSSGRVHIFR